MIILTNVSVPQVGRQEERQAKEAFKAFGDYEVYEDVTVK